MCDTTEQESMDMKPCQRMVSLLSNPSFMAAGACFLRDIFRYFFVISCSSTSVDTLGVYVLPYEITRKSKNGITITFRNCLLLLLTVRLCPVFRHCLRSLLFLLRWWCPTFIWAFGRPSDWSFGAGFLSSRFWPLFYPPFFQRDHAIVFFVIWSIVQRLVLHTFLEYDCCWLGHVGWFLL